MSAALLLGPVLVGSAAGRPADSAERVTLIEPVEIVAAGSVKGLLSLRLKDLAAIDPDQPVTPDIYHQTLSLFGREDLIADASFEYKATGCAPLASGAASGTVLDEIARRAAQTSIVIINESHVRSRSRGFIAEVAERLRPLGYDTLAMETLLNPTPNMSARFLPPYIAHPDLPYLEDGDGNYLSEAGFGRLGRRAKALGYRFVPYEYNIYPDPAAALPQDQRIAIREEAQATNLASFLRAHPGVRLLVHVGYSHAGEVTQSGDRRWMAARLKQKTGIDPLTISQTTCSGGGTVTRLAALPGDKPAGTFDLVIDHPVERFVRGRAEWRSAGGDQLADIPRKLRPIKGWRVIEARPVGEPTSSVPIDRVAIRPGEDVALMLPPGRYALRAIDVVPVVGNPPPAN